MTGSLRCDAVEECSVNIEYGKIKAVYVVRIEASCDIIQKDGTESMRSIIIAMAVIAICALTGSAAIAAQRQALCKFSVEGKTYIDGRCNFEVDPDGSFRIWDDVHTVYVNVEGNTAEASWNKNPKSFHADSPLGMLARDGACWKNATALVCARSLRAHK